MLEVMIKPKKQPMPKMPPLKDVIIKRLEIVEEYNEKGDKITKAQYTKINATKLANETKKLLKTQTAEEKLAEMEKIFSK